MDSTILITIAALACPISMGLMMWMMNRHQDEPMHGNMTTNTATPADRLAALQAEREALNTEIAELEAIKALEERRQTLEQSRE